MNAERGKVMKRVAHLLLLVFIVAVWGITAHATTVGRTVGSFAVSATGAATYSIPIWAPPGPHGMQPNMALVYSSQSSNGYVGVGWNLAGLSSIYRCNLTYAQDAAPAPVSLSTSDGYCLDGQRLRLTSGTYGTAGSTYQTEIANFKNVTAYGTAGSGPAYFIVQSPDGRTYQYGNGGNSQVLASGTSTALQWMLNEVSDPPGNTMTITYSTATGSAVPNVISWTPTSYGSSSYAYTMTFGYGTNVQPTAGYVAGTQVGNSNLLGSITIAYGGSQVKEYVLTYTQSGTTGRDTLTQVQECAASTSNCLYPTMISYQSGSAGVSTSATTVTSSSVPNVIAHYDFNGDGYKDLAYEIGTTWYVVFGSASGYGSPVNTGLTGTALFGDLTATGTDGILAKNGSTWYYYTWNGSSFVGTSTGLAYDTTASQFALADVNGDGLPDLVALYTPTSAVVKTRLNTSSGGTPSFSGSAVTAYSAIPGTSSGLITPDSQGGNLRSFDFNGDGRQDLAFAVTYCGAYYLGSCIQYLTNIVELVSQTGGTFSAVAMGTYPINSGGGTTFANVNNDACTDAILSQQVIYFSACNGNASGSINSTYPIVAVMDWNGDGLADLVENDGGTLYVQLASATGFGTATSTSLAYSSSCTYNTFDANGDGLDDLGCSSSSGFKYYLHNGAGTPPDLLSSVADGFGNSASPAYESIVRGNYGSSGGTYPDVPYIRPIYVANSVTYSDPSSTSGGTYNQTFLYYRSFMNVQGRGWDGFYEYAVTDSRTGLTEQFGHGISFPYTNLQYFDDVYSGSQEISQAVGTPAVTTLSSTAYQQRYFPYSSNITSERWEFGGTENGDLITTQSTNYTYDSYGNATTIAQTTTDNDPGSPYSGDFWTITTTNTPDVSTSPWCLNLLTQTQVAYTASLGGAVTRTKQFTPDLTNCRYTQVVTEPSSGTYKVTESLGFDSFGNINSDSITGVGMSARTSSASWGTTGQFPMNVTDPTGAQAQLNYNFSYGKISSKTDPNNLTTSWQYTDGFGRKTRETKPDGTYTTWNYFDMSGFGYLIHGLLVEEGTFTSGAVHLRDDDTGHDPVGRLVVQVNADISGGYNQSNITYDSLGRVASRSAPCSFVAWPTVCTYWTTTSYDALNRPTQVQRPISSINSTLQTTSYSYAGRTTTVTDPQSNATTTVTDVNGWERRTTDAVGYAVTIGYDAAGARTSVVDSGSNTLWSGTVAYGLKPYLTAMTDIDRGSWSFTVDALGERTAWTDAKGQHFSESFDALSRPLTRSEPDLYTAWTWGSSATNHNIGALQSVCTGTGSSPSNCTSAPGYSENATFDSLARLSQRSITLPGVGTFNYQWAFDATTGLPSTLTYPTSTSGYALQLQYGYAAGLLQSVTDISDPTHVTVWTANAENSAGQVTQETLGNGIVTNRAFDAVTHWLGSVTAGISGGSGVQNQSFLYDEMGNVTQRQDNNLGLTESAYYDNDYRLSYTKLSGTTNLSLGYSPNGNITSRSDVAGGATWTYSPTQIHAVTQAGSSAYQYTYDANGNATSRQGSSIAWTSYNYPTSASAGSGSTAETVSFAYGPDRSRWQQSYTGNGTTETTDYIGGLLELVTSGGVNDYRHYIYAGGEPVAMYSRKSTGVITFSYFLSDHQGSLADITNSSGTVDVQESFTPFGNRRNPTTWTGAASNLDLTTAASISREGYTFQTQLGLWMGMNHMNGRVQDAITGRFLSADPHGIIPTNAQSFNRYSYVGNNPLSFTDPTGFGAQPLGQSSSDFTNIINNILSGLGQLPVIPAAAPSGTAPVNQPYDTSVLATCNTMLNCAPLTPADACAIGTDSGLQQICANGGGFNPPRAPQAASQNQCSYVLQNPCGAGQNAQVVPNAPASPTASALGLTPLIAVNPSAFAPGTWLWNLGHVGTALDDSGVGDYILAAPLLPAGAFAGPMLGIGEGGTAIADGLGSIGTNLQKTGLPYVAAFFIQNAPGVLNSLNTMVNRGEEGVVALQDWAGDVEGELAERGGPALAELEAYISRITSHQ
jgi:RHS repeat-associated protein